jgi:RND superfamily putative drug exporter
LAATHGTAELLPIIVTAGLTVVLESASLIVAELGFLKAFGPGIAMSILLGLAVAVTLVPAVLAIGGRALLWPRRPAAELPREEAAEQSTTEVRRRPRRSRALELATRRPLLTVAGCTLLLLAAAAGLIRLDLGPLIRGLPRDADARESYRQASRGFAPGILSPTVVIVEGTGITSERRKLAALQELLERQPGVAEVVGPGDQPIRFDLGAALSTTGAAARYFVVSSSVPWGLAPCATSSSFADRCQDCSKRLGSRGRRRCSPATRHWSPRRSIRRSPISGA